MARSKVSRTRLTAFIWLLIGIGFVYLYFIFKIAKIFVFIGGIALFFSLFMYSRAGHFSAKAKTITCPQCGKTTIVVSRADACSHCKTPLVDESGRGRYKALPSPEVKRRSLFSRNN